MKKTLQVLAQLVGNIHKIDAAIEKGYSAWKGVYDFLSHLSPAAIRSDFVDKAVADAHAAADDVDAFLAPAEPAAEAAPVRPAVTL